MIISALIRQLTDAYNEHGDMEYKAYAMGEIGAEGEVEVSSTEVNLDDPEEPIFFFNL